jgi:hypothetical protein
LMLLFLLLSCNSYKSLLLYIFDLWNRKTCNPARVGCRVKMLTISVPFYLKNKTNKTKSIILYNSPFCCCCCSTSRFLNWNL